MLTHDNSANFIYRGHGGSRDLIRRRVLSLRYVFDIKPRNSNDLTQSLRSLHRQPISKIRRFRRISLSNCRNILHSGSIRQSAGVSMARQTGNDTRSYLVC